MAKTTVLTGAAVGLGFLFGFAIGAKTRNAAASNVSTKYNDGKVVITADVVGSLSDGITDFFNSVSE
jgi:hypothetical protein